MIQKLCSISGAIALLISLLFGGEAVAYNPEDPKHDAELRRMAIPTVLNGQSLTNGIPCETGACFKTADDTKGFSLEPLIEPPKPTSPPKAPKKDSGAPTET